VILPLFVIANAGTGIVKEKGLKSSAAISGDKKKA
jgi:hypothetical protein